MLKKWLLPAAAVLLLTGCSTAALEEYSLGAEYALRQAEIVPQQDALYATQLVPSTVTEVAWDENYILAKQVIADELPNSPDMRIAAKQEENYWIIDVKHNERFGPYNEKQFEAQKKEFRIADSLQLQDISKYMTKS